MPYLEVLTWSMKSWNGLLPMKQIPVLSRLWATWSRPFSVAMRRTWLFSKWPTGNSVLRSAACWILHRKNVWSLCVSSDVRSLTPAAEDGAKFINFFIHGRYKQFWNFMLSMLIFMHIEWEIFEYYRNKTMGTKRLRSKLISLPYSQ